MTDIPCPQCGHLALSVATRCPRCGHEFSADLLQPLPASPDHAWLRPALLAAAATAVVVVLALLVRGTRDEGEPAAPAAAPAQPSTLPVATASPPLERPVSPPPEPRTEDLPAAEPAPAAGAVRRWATNWINVRRSRGMGGAPVRVLQPGEAVLVDSLVRGWYRVVTDGRTGGYTHRRWLAAEPPVPAP
jgi:hypothetical protein